MESLMESTMVVRFFSALPMFFFAPVSDRLMALKASRCLSISEMKHRRHDTTLCLAPIPIHPTQDWVRAYITLIHPFHIRQGPGNDMNHMWETSGVPVCRNKNNMPSSRVSQRGSTRTPPPEAPP